MVLMVSGPIPLEAMLLAYWLVEYDPSIGAMLVGTFSIFPGSLDQYDVIYLAFLDLKAAFDVVPRKEIWNALIAKGVPGDLLAAIQSAYQGAMAVVRINGMESEPFPIARGVRQGDSLSPLLFINVMDEIHKICKRRIAWTTIGKWNMRTVLVQSLLYADDIVLLSDRPNILQRIIDAFSRYCIKWNLDVNLEKSEIVILETEYTLMSQTIFKITIRVK